MVYLNYIAVFLFSLLITYLLIIYSHKKSLFIDDSSAFKPQGFHKTPTPRVGGVAILLSFVLGLVHYSTEYFYLILICLPAFASGLLEDFTSTIKPKTRLMIMFVSCVLAILLLNAVIVDFGFFKVPFIVGVFITIVAILGLINGVNMIDGYNGLASSIVITILFNYFFKAIYLNDEFIQYTCLILILSLMGFLYFNFPQGKIFLGDGGAYFLGVILAVLSIVFFKRHESEMSPWYILLSLLYPVWEVIFSFTRKKLIEKKSPLDPDSFHFHMLVYRNLSFHKNTFVVFFIVPFIMALNLLANIYYNDNFLLFVISLLSVMFYMIAYIHLRKLDFKRWSEMKKIKKVLENSIQNNESILANSHS